MWQCFLEVSLLRHELQCRDLSSNGLKSQLIARLSKALKQEQLLDNSNNSKPDGDSATTADDVIITFMFITFLLQKIIL